MKALIPFVAVAGGCIMWFAADAHHSCQASGGQLVRGIVWFVCVQMGSAT